MYLSLQLSNSYFNIYIYIYMCMCVWGLMEVSFITQLVFLFLSSQYCLLVLYYSDSKEIICSIILLFLIFVAFPSKLFI